MSLRTTMKCHFISTQEIHNQIGELKLSPGNTIILRKPAQQNGKKVNAKWTLEVVQKTSNEPRPEPAAADNLKDLRLKCVLDAADIVKQSGIQFSNDEL